MSQQKRRFEALAKHCRLFQKQKPLAPRDGSGKGPMRRQQQHRLYEVRIESYFVFPGAAKRALLAITFFRFLFYSCGGRGMNEKRD